MNKEQYMKELKKRLRRLPKEEFEKAIAYFEEYFEDAGPAEEASAIRNLGTPEEAADQIIWDMAIQNTKKPINNMKKGASAVWTGILAVFALPIALPFLVVALGLVFVLLTCVMLFFMALMLFGIASVFIGPVCIWGGLSILFQNIPTALVCIGLGFSFIGVGLLMMQIMYYSIRKFFNWTVQLLGSIVKKGGRKNA